MQPFVHLHVHSHYSLLKALGKVPDLVAAAKKEGCEALALTDLGNLYGAIEFIKECRSAGIKPLIGIDATLESGGRLLLFAENEQGYKNLLAMVTEANLESEVTAPYIPDAILRARAAHLIAVAPALNQTNTEKYRDIFGEKNFYTDVALREVYYLKPSDRRAWETLCAIEGSARDESASYLAQEAFHFRTAREMADEFDEGALAKTVEIAARCNLDFKLGSWIFPPYPIPDGSTFDREFRNAIEEGIIFRNLAGRADVRERIEYEFTIITDKGYAPYFLVVSDLLRFAREQKILTTTRGSAAGSLISYLIGITNINPLEYNLPFERFLNPERPKAPDIDMDFADNRRDEVIDYARRKYGADRVAQIGTFGTMLARGVVRDVCRALGHPYGLGDRIAKEVPFGSQGFPMTLDRALKESGALAKMYENEDEVKEIIDLGKKIEGCARHISVHAAGVIIAPEPVVNFSPLQRDPKGGRIISQYDMYSITDEYGGVGLLKFDFLGIRNLAILAHSVELVEKTRGIHIDINAVPVDDAKTFEMLARGETEGTFQLNGAGMTRYLKEMKPTTIHDINAMVALFRPGPMESIPAYIERKHNPARIAYLDPRMKDILDRSYGVITYQDDVLMIAVKLAGYSWLEADTLRKAMGKKIPEEMEIQKEKLLDGFVKNGMTKEKADGLWKLIEPFAAYGFNKAHAASYGRVAYQTAYMKANFPVEYMAAILTAESGDVATVSIMVAECKRMGIPVLPPDINESFGDFTVLLKGSGGVVEDSIRFGLYSIKNFGGGVADSIITERKENEPFTSLFNFLRRVKDQNLNKKGLESLIMCGALDSFGERGAMLTAIEFLLEYHRDATKEQSQDSLFGLDAAETREPLLPAAPAAEMSQRLAWEKELLGLYVSGHPLEPFRERLAKHVISIAQIKLKVPPGGSTTAAGMIEDVRVILTRGGDQMAFVKLSDLGDSIEAVVFPKNFVQFKSMLRPEVCIALRGKLSSRNGQLSIIAEAAKEL